MIDEDFEAWVQGPICVSLHQRFIKLLAWSPIRDKPVMPNLEPNVEQHLQEILSVFGKYSADDLDQMSRHEYPWLKARGNLAIDEPCNTVIPKKVIRQNYQSSA